MSVAPPALRIGYRFLENALKMIRRAREEFPAADLADEFSVPGCDLAANRNDVGATFDFETFEGVVIQIHQVRFRGDFSSIIRVVNDEVGVAPELDGAFAREEAEELGGVWAGGGDGVVGSGPAGLWRTGLWRVGE